MKARPSILFAAISLASPAIAGPFGPPIADEELDTMRGGFTLPGGLDVSMAVTSDTRINGQLVLRSVLAVNQGPAVLTIQGRDASGALVSYNLDDGSSASSADGRINLIKSGDSTRIVFNGQGVDVSHLVGGAFGSVVANRMDGQTIDVLTTIDLNVSGSSPQLLGSSLMRVDTLALESTLRLVR